MFCLHLGTRYKRRGVDAVGDVANFVETEMVSIPPPPPPPPLLLCILHLSLCVSQILQAGSHNASYVLVRGSVPVFWTQPGTKYRPPPIIERGKHHSLTQLYLTRSKVPLLKFSPSKKDTNMLDKNPVNLLYC